MRLLTLSVLLLLAAMFTYGASAHSLPRQKQMTLKEQKAHQVRNLAHARGTVRFFENHPRLARTERGQYEAWWHGRAVRWIRRELSKTLNRLKAFFIRIFIPHYSAWLCIHRYEGAWNDPNPPYYGGLQMDRSFMRSYGSEFLRRYGTADRWPPLVQMQVAERAHRSGRGFSPWPTTRRMCGV